ncbi:MAG: hypothetical protein HC920_09550 [Oscillatoriales cyanobacterium SM2_3_0]|nr:hypothetical protein [Oscillatoriales cyanobacterium SM2_3_0]
MTDLAQPQPEIQAFYQARTRYGSDFTIGVRTMVSQQAKYLLHKSEGQQGCRSR